MIVLWERFFVDNEKAPKSAMVTVADFIFFAGVPSEELVYNKPKGFIIMVPKDEKWATLIKKCYPENFKKYTRYAIKKETAFDKKRLERFKNELDGCYRIKPIDSEIYDLCLNSQWSRAFVCAFDSKEQFLKLVLGMVVLKGNEIVAGASSYKRYHGGIEIGVDTGTDERRKHIVTAVCSALMLECLNRGLYPSWDAQNLFSVHLSQKLGYEFKNEYVAYEIHN